MRSSSFGEWRDRVRPLLIAGVSPEDACKTLDGTVEPTPSTGTQTGTIALPSALMRLLDSLSCYRAAGRYELMYRLAWRTLFENPRLLEDAADADVRNATLMDAAVRRDVHKMHAFVRFREVPEKDAAPAFFAWFEPEHEILRRGSVFFTKRFPNMRWTIATPDGAAVWDMRSLAFVDSPAPAMRPSGDGFEVLWRTYYRNICNVARINPLTMQREMPQKYWKNLPEAAEIGLLVRDGVSNFDGRHKVSDERGMVMSKALRRTLADIPSPGSGPEECRRCDLWKHATQAVPGEGPADARIMLVGEQPGDEEDLRGHPFVGPAGRVLDQALEAAAIERSQIYITNAVKHFKWEPRGKRRLHKKPDAREIDACNLWLDNEIRVIKPRILVALGASALRALTGSSVTIDAARSTELRHQSGSAIIATYHPSAILRADHGHAELLRSTLVADLKRARDLARVGASRLMEGAHS